MRLGYVSTLSVWKSRWFRLRCPSVGYKAGKVLAIKIAIKISLTRYSKLKIYLIFQFQFCLTMGTWLILTCHGPNYVHCTSWCTRLISGEAWDEEPLEEWFAGFKRSLLKWMSYVVVTAWSKLPVSWPIICCPKLQKHIECTRDISFWFSYMWQQEPTIVWCFVW